jgi:nucleotide-binding universal stress UspA family protein
MRAPKRVLVPFDDSELSQDALDFGITLARRLRADVTAFTALGDRPTDGAVPTAHEKEEMAQRVVDVALDDRRAKTSVGLDAVVRWGDPARAIEAFADEVDAGLVVMGTHGRKGLARTFVGSVAESVLRASARPVITLRENAAITEVPKHLLVATDFGDAAVRALTYAVELAALLGARVTVVTVFEVPLPILAAETSLVNAEVFDQVLVASGNALGRAVKSLEGRGVEIASLLREGDAHRVVRDLCGEIGADLVVLGTHGRQGISRAILGSVAESILRDAPVPVLTLRLAG